MAGGGRSLEYIWELIDKISPVLAKIDKQMAASQAKADALKKSAAGLDTAYAKQASHLEKAASAATKYAEAVKRVQKAEHDSATAMERMRQTGGYRGYSWQMGQRAVEAANREGDAYWSKRMAQGGAHGGPGGVMMDGRGRLRHRNGRFAPMGGGPGLIEGVVGSHYLMGGLRRVGRFLTAEDILHIERQMASAGVSPEDVRAARIEASRVAGLYPNISTAEALEMGSDLRAIFPAHGGKTSQAIATEHLAAVARKMSFLRSYEGGKHAKTGDAAMKEMMGAARSAEMFGKTSPEEFNRYLDWAIASKTAFGKTLSLQQMNTAQRQSVTAMMNVEEKFRFGAFNALVQTMGPRAGTGLQTFANKMSSGINWKKIGLTELGLLGLAGPDGKPNEALSRLVAKDPQQAVMQIIGAMKGKYGDDPIKIQQSIGRLLGDRTAMAFTQETVQNLSRMESMWALVKAAYEAQQRAQGGGWLGKDATTEIGAVAKAWNDLVNKVAEPLNPGVIWGLQKVRETLKGMGDFFEKHPALAAAAGSAVALGAAAATFGALRLGWSMLNFGPGIMQRLALGGVGAGEAVLGAGAGAAAAAPFAARLVRVLGFALKTAFWGAAAAAAVELVTSDQFADDYLPKPAADFVKGIRRRTVDWWSNNEDYQKRKSLIEADLARREAQGQPGFWGSIYNGVSGWFRDQMNPGADYWVQRNPAMYGLGPDALYAQGMMLRGAGVASAPLFDPGRPALFGAAVAAEGGAAGGGGSVPAAEAQREIAVRTAVDVSVSAGQDLVVRYEGPIGGPSSVPLKGEASRGESAPVKKD